MRISDWSSDVCSSDLLKGKFRLRLFPKITITVLPPRRFDIPDEARGRRRRQLAGDKLYEVMSDMMFRIHHQDPRTLFQALLESSAIHGAGKAAVEDIERPPHSYGRRVTGALVLGGRIEIGRASGRERVWPDV